MSFSTSAPLQKFEPMFYFRRIFRPLNLVIFKLFIVAATLGKRRDVDFAFIYNAVLPFS